MKKIMILIFILLLTVSGCGYTAKSLLPSHVKTVYVDNFRNKIDITEETEYEGQYRIYRPGLEREVTKTVKERFIFDGNLKVVNTSGEADSLLSCEIIDFRKEPLQYTDNKTVGEYRLKIIINMEFTDLRKNIILLDEKGFAGETTYTLSGAFSKTEASAQTAATGDLARRIVEAVVEGW